MDKRQLMEYRRPVQAVVPGSYAVYNPFYRVKHLRHGAPEFPSWLLPRKRAVSIEDALNVVGMRGEEVLEVPAPGGGQPSA